MYELMLTDLKRIYESQQAISDSFWTWIHPVECHHKTIPLVNLDVKIQVGLRGSHPVSASEQPASRGEVKGFHKKIEHAGCLIRIIHKGHGVRSRLRMTSTTAISRD